MRGRIVLLDHVAGREAAALMVDGRLEDLLIDPPDDLGALPGEIHRGIVGRPMKGQGGAFVELGDGHRGYLRQAKGLSPGTSMLVQVGSVAEPGKAPPVTPRLLFRSRYVIVTPGAPGINVSRAIRDEAERDRLQLIAHERGVLPEGAGLIVRSAAEEVDEDALVDDITQTAALATAVMADTAGGPELLVAAPGAHLAAWRDWAAPIPDAVISEAGCFEDHGVLDAVESVLSPDIALDGGGSARIEPTRALIAVDVDTGGDASPSAGLKANLALTRVLPRALRLKGLGGVAVVDAAPFAKKERRRVEDAMKREARLAGLELSVAGWTPLGRLELQIRRDRRPLSEVWPS